MALLKACMRATAPCCSPQAVGPGVLVGAGVGVAVGIAVGVGVAVAVGWLVAVGVGSCGVEVLVVVFSAAGVHPAKRKNKNAMLMAIYWRIKYCRTQNYRHNARS
jgi:hypothetical protein